MGRRRGRVRTGRRPLLTPAKHNTLMMALRAGNTRVASCAYAKVSINSFGEWMRRGKGTDDRPSIEPYISFVRDVEEAEAAAEVFVVASLRSAIASGDAAAAKFWLTTRRATWRNPVDEQQVQVVAAAQNLIVVTPEMMQRLATERIREERGDDDDVRAARARLVSDHAETE